MPAKLVYRNKEGRPTTFELSPEGATIGRGERNSIRLISNTVSSNHCRLVCADGSWSVEDLGSTNGTAINKKRIPRNGKAAIRHTDMLSCGALQLQFFNEPEERAEPARQKEPAPPQPAQRPAREPPSVQDVGALWQELDKITESLLPEPAAAEFPVQESTSVDGPSVAAPAAAAPSEKSDEALERRRAEELRRLGEQVEREAASRREAEQRAAELEKRLHEAGSYHRSSVELDEKLKQAGDQLGEARERAEKMEAQLKHSEQVVEQLRQQLGQADAQRRASDKLVEELRQKVALSEAQKHAAEVRAKDAQERVRRLEGEQEQAQRELQRLRQQLAAEAAMTMTSERREVRPAEPGPGSAPAPITDQGLLEMQQERSQLISSYQRSRRQLRRLRSEMERLRLFLTD